MGARCDECGYTLEGSNCYPCQRDQARAEVDRLRMRVALLEEAPPLPDLHSGELEPVPQPRGRMADGRAEQLRCPVCHGAEFTHTRHWCPVCQELFSEESLRRTVAEVGVDAVPAEVDRVALLESAILELRAEVERNRIRAVWQIVGIRLDLRDRVDPEIKTDVSKPHEHEIHGKPCCNAKCRGTWGADCPHCHRFDHRCGSKIGPS